MTDHLASPEVTFEQQDRTLVWRCRHGGTDYAVLHYPESGQWGGWAARDGLCTYPSGKVWTAIVFGWPAPVEQALAVAIRHELTAFTEAASC